MYKIRKQIIDKVNESQEKDVTPYVWETIPNTLKYFWANYFQNYKNYKMYKITYFENSTNTIQVLIFTGIEAKKKAIFWGTENILNFKKKYITKIN